MGGGLGALRGPDVAAYGAPVCDTWPGNSCVPQRLGTRRPYHVTLGKSLPQPQLASVCERELGALLALPAPLLLLALLSHGVSG